MLQLEALNLGMEEQEAGSLTAMRKAAIKYKVTIKD